MSTLSIQGQETVRNLAHKYGVSEQAVNAMLESVRNGGGTMAQFNVPELGGYGQWMRGGMTMVGDMFNHGLKARVDGLCGELSQALANGWLNHEVFTAPPSHPAFPQQQNQSYGDQQGGMNYQSSSSPNWYPSDLGHPSTSGSQNDMRYAWFPGSRRLAVQVGGQVTIFDTQDHHIGGVSQQQSGGSLGSLRLSSQFGDVDIYRLPVISGPGPR